MVFSALLARQNGFACLPAPMAARGQCMKDLNFNTLKPCDATSVKTKQQAHVYQPDHLMSPTFAGWKSPSLVLQRQYFDLIWGQEAGG